MTNISKLKKDIEIVRRALSRDKQGYDADGYDAEGFDRYGRSREMMERSAEYERMAFEALTPDEQAVVLKACEIQAKYEQKAMRARAHGLESYQVSLKNFHLILLVVLSIVAFPGRCIFNADIYLAYCRKIF